MSSEIDFDRIRQRVHDGVRLTREDAKLLLDRAEFLDLAEWADGVRRRKHPEREVSFVVDRNINYTNVCVCGCRFCAFFRKPGSSDGYVLDEEKLDRKLRETRDAGGTRILLQGGLNPDLDIRFHCRMLERIRGRFLMGIHGYSPPEIRFIAKISGLSIERTIRMLRDAGLESIPGGGAEILEDKVRRRISPRKCSSAEWLEVMETAHGLGIRSTATMMFGHVESTADRISHLGKIRDLQDRTRGFIAFIPWPFQPGNTGMRMRPASAVDYLRTLAVSRLMLDNIPNIQSSWVTQGDKVAQAALAFGANDMGSTMMEENVVAAAGVSFSLSQDDLCRLIRGAGYTPVQRDSLYRILRRFPIGFQGQNHVRSNHL